jgi:hypothetical protein
MGRAAPGLRRSWPNPRNRRLSRERQRPDETRVDHAVVAGLARADGVEQPDGDDRQALLPPSPSVGDGLQTRCFCFVGDVVTELIGCQQNVGLEKTARSVATRAAPQVGAPARTGH